ncbi:MAG: DUF3306 domain-containing protein [Hyphomicrobiaceae bacterium]|nr:DUF3306 domain-containing protein [Hyphomicrobiaceae bacterium]
MNGEPRESFLGRWARLKEAGKRGEPAAAAPVPENPVGVEPAPALAVDPAAEADRLPPDDRTPVEASPPPPARDFTGFDFDALDFSSDYTQFMGRDVPEDVRNKALRKLWVSDPILANLDGLDDYRGDYTDSAVAVPHGMLKTAYQYGRGFLSNEEVAEWEAIGRPEEPLPTTDADETRTDPSVVAASTGEDEAIPADGPADSSATGAACAMSVKAQDAEMLADYEAEFPQPANSLDTAKDT